MSNKEENVLKPSMVEYVHEMCNQIDYGKVIITLNKTSRSVDITTEIKQKFDKN